MRMSPRDYYEQHQPLYNLFWSTSSLHYGLWTPGTKSLAEAIVNTDLTIGKTINLGPTDRVLDLGSGTGGTAISLARHFGCQVTGVTISPRQQPQATRNAQRAGVADRVTFIVGDFDEPLDLPPRSFTAIISVESFCYAHDKLQSLKYLRPLLAERGRILIDDGFLLSDNLDPDQQRLYDICRQGWQVPSLTTVDQLSTMLAAAGFRNIQSEDHTTEVLPSNRRINRWGKLFIGPAWLLTRLRLVPQLAYDNARCMIAQEKIFERTARYAIVTAVC